MGKSSALLWNNFLLLQNFWIKNAKIHFFKEKNGFERCCFFELKVYVVTNRSTRLEKH